MIALAKHYRWILVMSQTASSRFDKLLLARMVPDRPRFKRKRVGAGSRKDGIRGFPALRSLGDEGNRMVLLHGELEQH